jgi:hypothetical protein
MERPPLPYGSVKWSNSPDQFTPRSSAVKSPFTNYVEPGERKPQINLLDIPPDSRLVAELTAQGPDYQKSNVYNLTGMTAPPDQGDLLGATQSPCLGCTGCTGCPGLPTPDEIKFLFFLVDEICQCSGDTNVPCGNTSEMCTVWNSVRGVVLEFVTKAYCFIANFTCNSPGKCLVDFLTGATGGICSGSLDPERRECALKVFLQQSGLPPFPTSFVKETVGNAILGFSSRSITYTYLPILIIGLLMIWIMVGVGWIGVGAGIIFTVGLFAIMYFFFVSYRSSFEVYVNDNIESISSEVEKYKATVSAAIPKIPGAAASALCAYTGNCFQCEADIPSCSGCTSVTAETLTQLPQPCSGCSGHNLH